MSNSPKADAVFLDLDTMGAGDLDLAPLADAVGGSLEVHGATEPDEVARRIADARLVFLNKVKLGRAEIESAGRLGFVGLTATGVDNIDLEAAGERGVVVANIRDYCTQSVVQHVMGVMLSLTHRLAEYTALVAAGDWQQAGNFCLLDYSIRELAGRRLGIVGYGALGRGVARMGEALGMEALISERPGADSVRAGRRPFEEVLTEADVLSLHCPLTEVNRGMIGAGELQRMKPDAVLINTARGALVDTAALAAALTNGRIAGAGIDVLPQEPPVDGDPLLDYRGDNLILTPHIAWAARESRQRAIAELAENARAWLAGEPRNRVN
ncbi:D-2-hydroxyacid dehydrogenase [Lentisalinibacter orientalis]|uniref:D-2-hydroxyacid dehydrogenase n=1 Tax=Lentisalinibacter orientalis TaxID=2992241 RepID=UPI00386E9C5C